MEIKVLWLYNDVMDLYGDKGNIKTLEYRCEKRGIKFALDTATIGDEVDFTKYDLIFIGGGADKEQRMLAKDLYRHKNNIKTAIENDVFFLLICGAYQLFGKYYIDARGNEIEGLGIFDYYTKAPDDMKRCIGNVAVKTEVFGKDMFVVGFENHGGQTIGVSKPFAKVLYGNGNTFKSSYEGVYDKNVLGTYIHGSLLPRNNHLADAIIEKLLTKKYGKIELMKLDDNIEESARKVMLNRMNIN